MWWLLKYFNNPNSKDSRTHIDETSFQAFSSGRCLIDDDRKAFAVCDVPRI